MKKNQATEYLKYSGLAFQMIAVILLSWWIGHKIDRWTETGTPIFTVIAILTGIIVSLVVVIINAYKSK
jgi:F0F1-type ATP synthase assembly protein I